MRALLLLLLTISSVFATETSYQIKEDYPLIQEQYNWNEKEFQVKQDKFNLNYSNDTIILKVKLSNKDINKKRMLWLDVLSPGEIIFLDSNKKVIDSYGINNKKSTYFPYTEINEGDTFYILRKGHMRFDGRVKVVTPEVMQYAEEYNNDAILIFIGALLFLLLFNMGYYVISKNPAFLHYSLFNTFFGGTVLVFGLFFNKIFGHAIVENNQMVNAGLSAVFAMTFARYYIEIKKHISAKKYKAYLWTERLIFIVSIAFLFVEGPIKPILSSLIDASVGICVVSIVAIPFSIRKNNPVAYFYLAAWASQIIGVSFLYAYEYLDFGSEYHLIRYSLLIGCFLEMIINSFGLAYKVKQMEKKKTEAEMEAKQKRKYQHRLRVLAHDVANPLTAAMMSAQVIDKMPEMKTRVENSLNRIKELLEEARDLEKNITTRDPNAMCLATKAYERLKENFKEQLSYKNLSLEYSGEESLEVPMEEDPLVENVLGNLLSNAIKFSPEGSTIRLNISQPDYGTIQLSMKDSGAGMSPEVLEKLRAGEMITTLGTNNEKGTGFGTKIMQEIVEDHHGKIEIESEAGEGTCFTISLPL